MLKNFCLDKCLRKGTIIDECGKLLEMNNYSIRVFNTINVKKSMHYNPFEYGFYLKPVKLGGLPCGYGLFDCSERYFGHEEGRKEGIGIGTDGLASVINKLIAQNRQDDVQKLVADKAYREKVMSEFGYAYRMSVAPNISTIR